MCSNSIYITRLASKVDAFVVGDDLIPACFREKLTIKGDIYCFTHAISKPLECKPGDLVYYGCDHGEGPALIRLDPRDYFAVEGVVYARTPIYQAQLVDDTLPDFLKDINISFVDDHWCLDTPRLRIPVRFGDYWIRDIDPFGRYDIPLVSALERNNDSFEKFWRCDKDGNPIERLTDYDARTFLAP